MAWSVKTAAADGEIDPNERQLLLSLADKCGVEQSRVEQMMEMAIDQRLDVPDPPDRRTAHIWLSAMAAAAMADGSVKPQEAQLLSTAAQRFGFSSEDVNLVLRQQYGQRLSQARDELRTARSRRSGNGDDQ